MSAPRILIAVLLSCAVSIGAWHWSSFGAGSGDRSVNAACAEFERPFSEAPEVFDLRAGVAAMATDENTPKDLSLDIEALEHFKAGDLLFAEGALTEARAESGWTPFRRMLAAELLLSSPENLDTSANLDDAMAHLEAVLQATNEADVEWARRASLLRAEIERRRGDDAAAMATLETLAETTTHLGLALVYTRLSGFALDAGDAPRAHEFAVLSVEADAEHLEGWLARGRAARLLAERDEDGALQDARLAFEAARELEATNAEAELGLGLCAFDAYEQGDGSIESAIAHFERAQELAPGDDAPLLAMGDTLLSIGQPAGALEQYRAALQTRESVTGYLKLASLLFGQAEYEEAELAFRRALRGARQMHASNVEYAAAHNGLGACLLAQGHREQARGSFEQAAELNPADPAPRRNLERLANVL